MSRHRRPAARGGAAGPPLPLGPSGARRRPAEGRARAAADCRSRPAPRGRGLPVPACPARPRTAGPGLPRAAADCRSRPAPRGRRRPVPAYPAAGRLCGALHSGLAARPRARLDRGARALRRFASAPPRRPRGAEVAVRLEKTPQDRLAPPSRASGDGPRRRTRGVGGRACPAAPPPRARPSPGCRTPHRGPRLRGGLPENHFCKLPWWSSG
ncbi:translation initiation factor IF-2-like [Moschus berezovskii]|uniref:translation initiation factor IF-2-like n=1 Tax=Moschus berezovskii TaxID=68408 RepID=UPI002444DC68|nr:translation initiation factor IF-2-like [Moschus berezovskii]